MSKTTTTKTTTTKTATTKTNTTAKTNATKTNESVETLLTTTELKKFFVDNGVIPKYTDSKHYVGCGTRANIFSVNALKTQYNIYCNDSYFKLFDNDNYDIERIENGNSSDKTRNNTIIVKSTETLKKMLTTISGLNGAVSLY